MAASLNQSNYTTVWNDNFAGDSGLNSSLFPIRWGNSSEFSFGGNGVTLTSNGNAAGFMNRDMGANNSTGYGLYQATLTIPQNQSYGAYVDLWPSTNGWPGPELDLFEQYNGQPYCTVHWKGGDGGNAYHSFTYNANLSQPVKVALDWEPGSLTFYVNGQQVVQYQSGGSVPIPKDYADGGQNASFGIGDSGPAGTRLTVSNMSYSTHNAGASTPAPAPAPAPSVPAPDPTPAAPVSLVGPVTMSNPGMQFVANPQSGANAPITISAPGITEAYAFVMNSHNQAESSWIGVPLNAQGQGTYNFHFQNTGDYVVAVADTRTDSHAGYSGQISILHS